MPIVNGKEYPYTDAGKKAAKKAALQGMLTKKKGKKKQSSSGMTSQGY